jgi:hypothetical protein
MAAVSSVLWKQDGDAGGDESGTAAVADWLRQCVAEQMQRASADAVVHEVIDVCGQLRGQVDAERAALADHANADEVITELEAAKAASDRARGAASHWGQALVDAFTDAGAGIERDLRDRSRALTSEVDELVERSDPASSWGEFQRWLYSRAAEVASEHCARRHELLLDAVGNVCAVFDDDVATGEELVAPIDVSSVSAPAEARLDVDRPGVMTQALTLMRGSYGGLAMFGFLGGFAGVTLAAPVLAGLGLFLGGRGLKDERHRQLAQRRAQARVSARKYLDEVTFALTSESRESLRIIQRSVRDHFARRAEEAQRTATEALAAAKRAAESDGADRSRRLADVEAELERIDGLAQRAAAVATAEVA